MCGKNKGSLVIICLSIGSPPRVREKPNGSYSRQNKSGITPACAGKTKCSGSPALVLSDHPRVCGKNYEARQKRERELGSPPRVREKQKYGISLNRLRGITPACAGKTIAYADTVSGSGDHPRVCGKNIV